VLPRWAIVAQTRFGSVAPVSTERPLLYVEQRYVIFFCISGVFLAKLHIVDFRIQAAVMHLQAGFENAVVGNLTLLGVDWLSEFHISQIVNSAPSAIHPIAWCIYLRTGEIETRPHARRAAKWFSHELLLWIQYRFVASKRVNHRIPLTVF